MNKINNNRMKQETQNIELAYLTIDDYQELKEAMITAYQSMPNSYWKESQIQTLLNKFPDGQIVIKVDGHIAGCALSIIIDSKQFEEQHTYKKITGAFTFDTHTDIGLSLIHIS